MPSRDRVLIRILTTLLLLWVGLDVGAHGLFVADFGPLITSGSETRLSGDAGGPTETSPAHGHCFCHGVSVGAVAPAPFERLAPASALVLGASVQVARGDRDPLDHPPQLPA